MKCYARALLGPFDYLKFNSLTHCPRRVGNMVAQEIV